MKRIALIFAGQGSQYVGMGKKWIDQPVVSRTFEEANDTLGFDLTKLCFEGDLQQLTLTENAQPAIVTVSVAAFRLYMQEIGIEPVLSAGHSLGEYSALCCANVISFDNVLRLVRLRGKLMQEAVQSGAGAMTAVIGVQRSLIEEVCTDMSTAGEFVGIANVNSKEQVVISGHLPAVRRASQKLADAGAKVVELNVSAPFHSPLMQHAADGMEQQLKETICSPMKWPVISNIDAKPYNHFDAANRLIRQITNQVEWAHTMDYMENQGIELAIEMGPQTILKKLASQHEVGFPVFAMDQDNSMSAIQKELEGSLRPIKTDFISRCLAISVCTKNRNFVEEEYKRGVVEPYRNMQNLQSQLEEAGQNPTPEQMRAALLQLRTLFETKGVPLQEQLERYQQLFLETDTLQMFKAEFLTTLVAAGDRTNGY
ncbi:ACP S-malonyltransferase [Paenibacillus oenotherae]|uniref:[acyl-carrier-protein] S-malonyltransferase n=1 Tax=Paenibacillus oenotherae TaxID=1435645 RepID=A0ABS7D7F0_9BACL|nr:ACP S-malonyltransferase [Paenibacillus oenotherae]MBW7475088.1 ACP S-malonyltransferase [Paenibacillus oenotherae]